MSSTNRGSKRSEADLYQTPTWVVRRLLEKCALPAGRWLECCAGSGAIIRATKEVRLDIEWSAVELQEEFRESLRPMTDGRAVIGDFMSLPDAAFEPLIGEEADVVITNPPFRLAKEVIDRAFDLGKWVVMLLRLNFLASDKRCDFMQQYPPDIYQLPNRPSFCLNSKGKPGTDSPEYCWMVWPPNRKRDHGKVVVLNRTPRHERLLP